MIENDLNEMTANASTPSTYDQNGNRITMGQGSGTTTYTYDDENRLIQVSYSTTYRTGFAYDGLGRMRTRTEYNWVMGTGWVVGSVTRYLYDGKRVIQERDGSNVPLVSYTRGLDLSSSLENAGGIGGLLARSHGYSGGTWSTHSYYHADAVGNVTYMISAAQAMVANYKYDPYGRTLSMGGSLASANVYRFSSKELHGNSGLYYYLYRFYDPNTQRWMNRDPIEEQGGRNLYQFCRNNPEKFIDVIGDQAKKAEPKPTSPPKKKPKPHPIDKNCPGLECQWPKASGATSDIPDKGFDTLPGAGEVCKKTDCTLSGNTCNFNCRLKYGDLAENDEENPACEKACQDDCKRHKKECEKNI